MTKLGYRLTTASIFVLAVCGAAVVWILADRTYVAGDRVTGWRMGVAGLALPALSLVACTLWLSRERRNGHALATVSWLKWALGISGFVWAGLVLFSLL